MFNIIYILFFIYKALYRKYIIIIVHFTTFVSLNLVLIIIPTRMHIGFSLIILPHWYYVCWKKHPTAGLIA